MRVSRQIELFVSLLVSVGCSGGGGGGGQGTSDQGGASGAVSAAGAQSASGSPSGGFAGASAGSSGAAAIAGGGSTAAGGTASGGASAAGAAGSAGVSNAGASQGGSGGTAASGGPFTCSLVLGLFTTSQWFNGTQPGGASKTFLQNGVDATKWEGKMQKYSYIEKWSDPANPIWNIPTQNACAANATTPDRVLFVGFSPGIPADQDYDKYHAQAMDQAGWETQLNLVIANIRAKYPSAKEIDILTMGRAPNNMLCANNSDTDTIIAAYEDAAYQAVADASNGLVKVGPKYFVPDCATSYIFANDSDYTTTGANSLAMQVATYYIAHP
jgi:hypothetical protein